MRWWLRISVCHLVRVRPRLRISGTQSSRRFGDGFVQQQTRVIWVVGEVDVSY